MAGLNRTGASENKRTVESIQNTSFDQEFGVIAVETTNYNPSTGTLDRNIQATPVKKFYSSTGVATDGIIWSPASGKRWYVIALYINVSAAATVTLEDDKVGGDESVFKSEFAANSGVFLTFPDKYPLTSGEDGADLLITTNAGNVYVTAIGYEA